MFDPFERDIAIGRGRSNEGTWDRCGHTLAMTAVEPRALMSSLDAAEKALIPLLLTSAPQHILQVT